MLAQVAPATPAIAPVLIWVGALIVAVLLLGIIVLLLRKKLFTKDGEEASGMLSDLRRMHKAGELTTEEYDAARKALTTRVAGRPSPAKTDAPTPRQRTLPPQTGEMRAKPGFDLTGAPLPKQSAAGNPPPPPPQPPPKSSGQYDRKPPST